MIFTEHDLYATAKLLKSCDGENPEYDRALVELISYLTHDDVYFVASKLGDKVDVPKELL